MKLYRELKLLREIWAVGHQVELPEMLDGREKRVNMQRSFLELTHCTLICFTLNIAGPVKVSTLTKELFLHGYDQIREAIVLNGFEVRLSEMVPHPYGYEAYWAVSEDSLRVKRVMVEI